MKVEEIKEAYSKMRIAVVGDFMLDEWWRGDVTRLNPEAPVPVVENPTITMNLGGAANVCKQLRVLGAAVDFYAVGGYDGTAQKLLCLTHQHGIAGYYFQDGGYTTPVKLRIKGNGQHIVRVDKESYDIDEGIQDEMLERIEYNLEHYHAVIMSDYNKGVLSKRVIHSIIEMCKAADVPVMVDPKRDNFWEYKGCILLKCNLAEILAQTHGGSDIDSYGVKTLCAMRDFPLPLMVVTKGSKGLIAINEGGYYHNIEAHKVSAKETSGAGDTVMAVLVLEYLRDWDFFGAAKLANKAGAIVVQKPGIAYCTVEELCGEV